MKGKIVGYGTVGLSRTKVENVCLVEGLKHNLLSISQLCDRRYKVIFKSSKCNVYDLKSNELIFSGNRHGNVYVIWLDDVVLKPKNCLITSNANLSWLWYKKLGNLIDKLARKHLVKGLPNINFKKDHVLDICIRGKQTRSSFKPIN